MEFRLLSRFTLAHDLNRAVPAIEISIVKCCGVHKELNVGRHEDGSVTCDLGVFLSKVVCVDYLNFTRSLFKPYFFFNFLFIIMKLPPKRFVS